MITIENTVLVLLAAGLSERFGDVGSKLDVDFLGKPLGLHVAVALGDLPFKDRVAVVDTCGIDYGAHGFHVRHNPDSKEGIASSIRMGVACARELGAEAVMFALADMPRVTAAHVHRMFDVADTPACVVASSDGVQPKPPSIFGRDRFDQLLALRGDQGARDLVVGGKHVVTSPAELIDVNTAEELEHLRELIRSPAAITRAMARRSEPATPARG